MFVTELGMVMSVRLEQLMNAPVPMLVTELGIMILVSPVQRPNTHSSIFVTELEMVMSVRLEQFQNAQVPMLVTELGIAILVRFEHSLYLQLIVYQCVLIKTVEK